MVTGFEYVPVVLAATEPGLFLRVLNWLGWVVFRYLGKPQGEGGVTL